MNSIANLTSLQSVCVPNYIPLYIEHYLIVCCSILLTNNMCSNQVDETDVDYDNLPDKK